MTTTNITNFRKNAFNYVEQTIKYNEPLSISVWTKRTWSGKCTRSSTQKRRQRTSRS